MQGGGATCRAKLKHRRGGDPAARSAFAGERRRELENRQAQSPCPPHPV